MLNKSLLWTCRSHTEENRIQGNALSHLFCGIPAKDIRQVMARVVDTDDPVPHDRHVKLTVK